MYKNYNSVLESDEVSYEDVLKNSRRQYELGILDSPEDWERLQKDEEANLALSPEEARILDDFVENVSDRSISRFPLFINGRAGSGKSTILQYLFAYYADANLRGGSQTADLTPVYFSCSQELIEKSRNVVDTLLALNQEHLGNSFDENALKRMPNFFKEFHKYLLSLLPPSSKSSKFSPGDYVDHSGFTQAWEKKFSTTMWKR